MGRIVTLFGIVLVLALTAGFILSAQSRSGNVPRGIPPALWIPLTETSGILLREPLLDRQRIVGGTLMIKVQDGWREVYLDNAPPGIVPLTP